MPRITHDSDKPNQNHLALLCMMDDSAQDSGIAMYGVAKDLPIIVRYYRAGSFRRGRRAGSMSTGMGCGLCCIGNTSPVNYIPSWTRSRMVARAGSTTCGCRWRRWCGGRDGRPLSSQHRDHTTGVAVRRGAARLLWVPCKQAKLKGAPCSC